MSRGGGLEDGSVQAAGLEARVRTIEDRLLRLDARLKRLEAARARLEAIWSWWPFCRRRGGVGMVTTPCCPAGVPARLELSIAGGMPVVLDYDDAARQWRQVGGPDRFRLRCEEGARVFQSFDTDDPYWEDSVFTACSPFRVEFLRGADMSRWVVTEAR
jgi:hypothetical protein